MLSKLFHVPVFMIFGLLVAVLACAVDEPPAASAPGADVVARLGDEPVTESELEASAGGAVFKARQELFQARLSALQDLLFERVLEKEAAAEDSTPEAVLSARLEKHLTPPDEAQVERMFQQFRARLPEDEEAAKGQVRAYLMQQSRQSAEARVREELFATYDVKVLMDPPRADVPVRPSDPSRGPADAPVTLVEYSDFQCPYCVRVQDTLDQLEERYGDRLRHVFKQLPLPMHAQAELAARASLCAADQGEFWPLHDWLFANRSQLSRDSIVAAAVEAGVDEEPFSTCLDEERYAEQVAEDIEQARRYGITGTPGFLVNGRFLGGAQPLENFVEVIDDELRRAGVEPPQPEAQPQAEAAAAGS